MAENNSKHWSIGCKIICWRYNTQIHRTIGNKSPYHVTFGQLLRCGISNFPLSTELLDSLHTEDELMAVLEPPNNNNEFLRNDEREEAQGKKIFNSITSFIFKNNTYITISHVSLGVETFQKMCGSA